MMNRKERERLQHRREIIAAARRVFAARGYAETTIDDVADAAEFGRGTLYNYFTGKEELFGSVIDETLEELTGVVVSSLEDATLAFEVRIESLTRAMLSYAIQTPESLYLIARELRVPILGTRAGDAVARMIEPLTDSISAEQHAGRLVGDIEPLVLAQVLMNMILGRFLTMIRARLTGADAESGEAWYNGLMAARADETLLRQELENAVTSVCRVFLHGTLISQERADDPRPTSTSTDQ